MTDKPSNWGDWHPCKLCNTVQPPRGLDSDGCCLDKMWCARARHATPPPENGHKHVQGWENETPIECATKPAPKQPCCEDPKCVDCPEGECECEKKKKPRKKPAKKGKK